MFGISYHFLFGLPVWFYIAILVFLIRAPALLHCRCMSLKRAFILPLSFLIFSVITLWLHHEVLLMPGLVALVCAVIAAVIVYRLRCFLALDVTYDIASELLFMRPSRISFVWATLLLVSYLFLVFHTSLVMRGDVIHWLSAFFTMLMGLATGRFFGAWFSYKAVITSTLAEAQKITEESSE